MCLSVGLPGRKLQRCPVLMTNHLLTCRPCQGRKPAAIVVTGIGPATGYVTAKRVLHGERRTDILTPLTAGSVLLTLPAMAGRGANLPGLFFVWHFALARKVVTSAYRHALCP